MNERIRALAEQANMDYELRPEIARAPVWIALDDELAEFAELIIRESIEVMMKNDYHGEWLGEKVKEHFGVEE